MATFTALCLGLSIRGRKEKASKIQGKEPPGQLREQIPPHLEIKITPFSSQSRQLSPRHPDLGGQGIPEHGSKSAEPGPPGSPDWAVVTGKQGWGWNSPEPGKQPP